MKERDYIKLEEYYSREKSNSELVENLFENEKNEPELQDSLNTKWNNVLNQPSEKLDLKHILHKIHFNINSNKLSESSTTKQLYSWFSRIAVVLVLPLLALCIYFMVGNVNQPVQFTEIVAPKGEKAQFVLPDGSTGFLNSGSTLKYAYPFLRNRLVQLSGEGFFDVAHNNSEFVVQAQGVKVKVHGTRFNVCAYDDEPEIITTLEQGSVSVIRDVDGNEIEIKPGQQAVFRKENQEMYYKTVDIDLYVAWKENMLRFQNTPFIDVVKKMERWYDVKMILEEDLKYTQRYTMTIKTESLREMLDLMVVTTPMKYEIKEDIVYITNTKNEVPMK